MDTGIIIFAYNRSRHLKEVLEGLKANEGVSKLHIFQDGLKYEGHREEWEKTRRVIDGIDWCEVVYTLASHNKGLANSIVDGIDTVFRENDAVIVLEDDCVPTANFISFMNRCFDKYRNDKRVYSVSGYSWPIDLPEGEYDIYGCGRTSSWGWGTWKDRWEQYSTDSGILKRLKEGEEGSRYLAAWGMDCEQMLLDQILGKNDTWDVNWTLVVMERRGICINPYKSLIHNIGMDGTGVHCGITDMCDVEMDIGERTDFNMPDDLNILRTTEYAFADLYGNYTAASVPDASKENVLVYGLGNFFARHEKEINNDYNVVAFIDRSKRGWYAGKKILKLSDVKDYIYDKVIIMVQSIQECVKIAGEMIGNGIGYESVVLGHNLYGAYVGAVNGISITDDGKLCARFGDVLVKIASEDEFNKMSEVLVNNIYSYFVNNAKRDVVIDVGMNVGDSPLYFARQENVDKVYAYEPFEKTFARAEENLRQYIDAGRVNIFKYGISRENAVRSVGFNVDMTCGQSTLGDVREYAYIRHHKCGLVQEKNEQTEYIEVKKASDEFGPIINGHPHHNIILKMDCEGEEYGILEELSQSGILEKFKFIMLEWHYNGKGVILGYLEEAGFSWWCSDRSKDMGLIYAYK